MTGSVVAAGVMPARLAHFADRKLAVDPPSSIILTLVPFKVPFSEIRSARGATAWGLI